MLDKWLISLKVTLKIWPGDHSILKFNKKIGRSSVQVFIGIPSPLSLISSPSTFHVQ